MNRIYIPILVLLLIINSIAYSQTKKEKLSVLYGGLSLPMDDLKDASTISFGLGFEYNKPMSTQGLFWSTSLNLLLNGDDISDTDYYWFPNVGTISGKDLSKGKYINIPIFSGLKFSKEVSPEMNIYGLGQAGINCFKAPKIEFTKDGQKGSISHNLAISIGFCLGGGVYFLGSNINIGFRYFHLGSSKIKATTKFGTNKYETESENINLSIIMFSIGMHFSLLK